MQDNHENSAQNVKLGPLLALIADLSPGSPNYVTTHTRIAVSEAVSLASWAIRSGGIIQVVLLRCESEIYSQLFLPVVSTNSLIGVIEARPPLIGYDRQIQALWDKH